MGSYGHPDTRSRSLLSLSFRPDCIRVGYVWRLEDLPYNSGCIVYFDTSWWLESEHLHLRLFSIFSIIKNAFNYILFKVNLTGCRDCRLFWWACPKNGLFLRWDWPGGNLLNYTAERQTPNAQLWAWLYIDSLRYWEWAKEYADFPCVKVAPSFSNGRRHIQVMAAYRYIRHIHVVVVETEKAIYRF